MKRKLTITITKIKRQTVSAPAHVLRAHCPACEREVETVTEAEAARILQVDGLVLDRLIAGGHVHAISTVTGSQQICKRVVCRNTLNHRA